MRIVVTGAGGLIGWHSVARLHAANCAARFTGAMPPYDLVALDHAQFADDDALRVALRQADAVMHFAGVNRASDADIERENPAISQRLVDACAGVGASPHIVYANSTHADSDAPYGRSKRIAGQILAAASARYTEVVLPHIFGECARPRYNNVTATFIEAVIAGDAPSINPDGVVALLHAGAAAQVMIDAVMHQTFGTIRPQARDTRVIDLFGMLQKFHADYRANIFPNLRDAFELALFNSYRAALYPTGFGAPLKLNTDARGTLFEAVKGGGGGQVFLSMTEPGITRGDHFHLHKVERFVVVQGDAIIRIRKVLGGDVWDYHVSGSAPTAIDMPTLHTHSIENIGAGPLLTMFWTHDLFDPEAPDTYFDPVLKAKP